MANIALKMGAENLLPWSHMEDWAENGTSAAPTGHTLSGAGASVAREATIFKIGTYSAAVTRGGADTDLSYSLSDFADYQGLKMTFGCWVYATVASRARLQIDDGVGTSESSYHTGGSSWEFLTVTHDVDNSATELTVNMEVNTGDTTAYFDGGVLAQGTQVMQVLSDIVDVAEINPATRYRARGYDITRREGQIIPSVNLESKTFRIRGEAIGSTPTASRNNLDLLHAIVNSCIIKPNGDLQRRELYMFDDRVVIGHTTSMSTPNTSALLINEYDFRFETEDPYFQYINKTRVKQSLSTSTVSFTVTNGGNACTFPEIRITAGGSNITSLTVKNLTTHQSFSYSGAVTSGNELVINTKEITVENNSVPDLANLTGETQMILYPGANSFEITSSATGGTARIDFYNRWH